MAETGKFNIGIMIVGIYGTLSILFNAMIRHPIYLFGLLLLLALIVYMRKRLWLVPWGVFTAMQVGRARKEECVLANKFREACRQYKKNTWFRAEEGMPIIKTYSRRAIWASGFILVMWGTALAAQAKPLVAVDPVDQVKRLGRGVNILGYDPIWDHHKDGRFKEKHFKLIREAGFQSVRINLHALQRMDAGNGYKLDDGWLKTLDWAVKGALANGLMVILDLHNYNDVAENPAAFKPRVMAFWKQVAERYKKAPDSVIFEILNEPNGGLTAALWNEWLVEALAVIRATNPARTVVLGPPEWNGFRHLDELALPEGDRNIIVTVHYYEPMRFTHQGAAWTPEFVNLSGVNWGSPAEIKQVEGDFARVEAWSAEHRRPILLGEFGAYDKSPMDSRARYTAFVARAAESLGWAWAYWQFDSDFIVYDIEQDRWVEPIKNALVPQK